MYCSFIFCFKQKTAYEMRISDWISDVCSSDLPVVLRKNWLSAYDFVAASGAQALNDHARSNDPFAEVGKIQVAVDVSSVIRSEERRGGKECVSTCSSRRSPDYSKKKSQPNLKRIQAYLSKQT